MRTLTYTIAREDDGRLLKRVARSSMGLSAHTFARLKARGAIMLDGVRARANTIVKAGQTLSALIDDDAPASNRAQMDDAPINIVYEDEDIIVINKPAPLATQSSSRQPESALENRLSYLYRDIPNFVFRPVNRLDKGTSGLMLAAKHSHAQWALARTLHTPEFARGYLAITQGVPDPLSGVIDAPIAKCEGATIKREVRLSGKPSVTRYLTLATLDGRALVSLALDTGRTHQIRVHMKYIGCPVFGDFLYGEERRDILPGRFALHSARLSFAHPATGARMAFYAPLPDQLRALMRV